MKIVAVINYKGGVGKTSLTANLAGSLARSGKRVLMIDLDPQASLTFSFLTPDDWEANYAPARTIKTWFESLDTPNPISLRNLICHPSRVAEILGGRGQLDLICSHLGLINVDLELATKLGGANLAQAKRNFLAVHRRLIDGLDSLAPSQYDIVLIDCPPNFNIVTKTAIVASDYILVPARPDYLSTLGIDYLIRNVTGLVRDYNDYASVDSQDVSEPIEPKLLGVVFTMIQEYGGQPMATHRTFMARVAQMNGLRVLPNYMKRNDNLFGDAPQYGVPVVLMRHAQEAYANVISGIERVAGDVRAAIGF